MKSRLVRGLWVDLMLLAIAWPYFIWGRLYPTRIAFACAFAVGAMSFLVRRGYHEWLDLYRRSIEPPFESTPTAADDDLSPHGRS